MVRILLFISSLSFILSSCMENKVTLEKHPFVSSITSDSESWSFEYDANRRIVKTTVRQASSSFSSVYSFTYNDKGEVISSKSFSSEGDRTLSYEYNNNGEMTGVFEETENGVSIQKINLNHDEDKIWVHSPDADSSTGSYFYMQDENVASYSCLNCPLSSFKFEYASFESILPQNVRKYWKFYAKGIPFLNDLNQIGSNNFVNYYYALSSVWIPIAVRNKINLDKNLGLPVKVEVLLTDDLTIPPTADLKSGDILNTYIIDYINL